MSPLSLLFCAAVYRCCWRYLPMLISLFRAGATTRVVAIAVIVDSVATREMLLFTPLFAIMMRDAREKSAWRAR